MIDTVSNNMCGNYVSSWITNVTTNLVSNPTDLVLPAMAVYDRSRRDGGWGKKSHGQGDRACIVRWLQAVGGAAISSGLQRMSLCNIGNIVSEIVTGNHTYCLSTCVGIRVIVDHIYTRMLRVQGVRWGASGQSQICVYR